MAPILHLNWSSRLEQAVDKDVRDSSHDHDISNTSRIEQQWELVANIMRISLFVVPFV